MTVLGLQQQVKKKKRPRPDAGAGGKKEKSGGGLPRPVPPPPSGVADAEGDDFGDLPLPPSDDEADALDSDGALARPPPPPPPPPPANKKQKPGKAAWAATAAALAGLASAPPADQASFLWTAYASALNLDEADGELGRLRSVGGAAILPLPPPGDFAARLARADARLASSSTASPSVTPSPIASPVILALSASANHCLDMRRAGVGGGRALKLFARHIKIAEQVALLRSPAGRAGAVAAVGTPARVLALVDAGALSLASLRLLVLDMRRDAKQRTVLDLPETRGEVWALFGRGGVGERVASGEARVGLFDSGGGGGGGPGL